MSAPFIKTGTTHPKRFRTGGRQPIIDGLYKWSARKATTTYARMSDSVAVARHRVRGQKRPDSVGDKTDDYFWAWENCARPIVVKDDESGVPYVDVGDGKCAWCQKNQADRDVVWRTQVSMVSYLLILGNKPMTGGEIERTNSLELYYYNTKKQWRLDEAVGADPSLKITLKFSLGDSQDEVRYQKYEVTRARPDENITPTPELVKTLTKHMKELKTLEKIAATPSYEDTVQASQTHFRPSAASEIGGGQDEATQSLSDASGLDALQSESSTSPSAGGGSAAVTAPPSDEISEDELENLLKDHGLE